MENILLTEKALINIKKLLFSGDEKSFTLAKQILIKNKDIIDYAEFCKNILINFTGCKDSYISLINSEIPDLFEHLNMKAGKVYYETEINPHKYKTYINNNLIIVRQLKYEEN